MSLFDFIKKNDTKRFFTYGIGKLATNVISNIAGWSANESLVCMLYAKF